MSRAAAATPGRSLFERMTAIGVDAKSLMPPKSASPATLRKRFDNIPVRVILPPLTPLEMVAVGTRPSGV